MRMLWRHADMAVLCVIKVLIGTVKLTLACVILALLFANMHQCHTRSSLFFIPAVLFLTGLLWFVRACYIYRVRVMRRLDPNQNIGLTTPRAVSVHIPR